MTRYLHQFSYSTESVKAMAAKPQDRRKAAEKLFSAGGGKLIDMYFCFGEYDGIAISEFPSNVSAAVSMTLGASGAFSRSHTTVLLTMDQAIKAMRKASKVAGGYKPPAG